MLGAVLVVLVAGLLLAPLATLSTLTALISIAYWLRLPIPTSPVTEWLAAVLG